MGALPGGTVTDRPHLSHSQLQMLARCPKQWEYRYVYGLKSPPGVALVIGKGTHKAIEKDMDRKMAWGTLMEPGEIQDVARDATLAMWDREPPVQTERDPTQGEAVDMAVSLAALHHDRAAPSIEPIAVEQAFVVETPQLPFDVVGVVDVETATHVRDVKTAAKKPTADVAKRSTQLALYHLRATLAGGPSKKVALDYLIKTRERQYIPLEAEPDADDHRALLRRLEMAAASIKSGIFPPTSTDSIWCTERFCGYWDRCEFGSKKRVSVGLIDPSRLTTRLIQLRNDELDRDKDAGDGSQ